MRSLDRSRASLNASARDIIFQVFALDVGSVYTTRIDGKLICPLIKCVLVSFVANCREERHCRYVGADAKHETLTKRHVRVEALPSIDSILAYTLLTQSFAFFRVVVTSVSLYC